MSLSPRGKSATEKIYVYNYMRFVDITGQWSNRVEYELEITNIVDLYKQLEIIKTLEQNINNSEPKQEYQTLLDNLVYVRNYIVQYKLFYESQRKYLLREKKSIKEPFYKDNSIKIVLRSVPDVLKSNKRIMARFEELQDDHHTFIANFNSAKRKLKKLADI